MALNIQTESTRLQVVAGYESGHTMVFVQNDPGASFQKLYSAHSHSQSSASSFFDFRHHRTDREIVLSMGIFPLQDSYVTSSADAVIAKHPLPSTKSIWQTELKPYKVVQTKHSGQQGLSCRSDGKIFATAGWDSRIRVYSSKTVKELAVLKWHKSGCYATAFADVEPPLPTKAEDPPIKEEPDGDEKPLARQSSAVSTVQRRRDTKAQSTHWLAAGSKDGKVSLWVIY